MNTIKERIKELSAEQRQLRKERSCYYDWDVENLKDLNLIPRTTRDTSHATMTHAHNRYILRHLFHAYAIVRGKTLPLPKRAILDQSLVDRLVEQYNKERQSNELHPNTESGLATV